MTIMDAAVGDKLIIRGIDEGDARRRLLDFGFTKGAEVTVCNAAPFGGTILVSIRGYVVAIRDFAGKLIRVEYPEEARRGRD